MNYIGIFIALAIMLGIGTLILGGSGVDCSTVSGYTSGVVTSVSIGTAGNYTSAPTATFSAGTTTAIGTVATTAIAGGVEVARVDITSGGSGYLTAPTVTFSGGAPVTTPAVATAVIGTDAGQEGWAAQCVRNQTQSQAGYNLLIITLIVLAAVVVLTVVRMLS